MAQLPVLLLAAITPAASAFMVGTSARSTTAPRVVSPPILSESLAVTTAKGVFGITAQPIAWASLYTLATSGCGLRGETAGTLEGVAYAIIAGFLFGSAFTRLTMGGLGLGDAELQAAAAEMEVLESMGASEEQKRASKQKADDLANGPANLLSTAERLSFVTAAAAVLVVGSTLLANGALPSAVPVDGAACWT